MPSTPRFYLFYFALPCHVYPPLFSLYRLPPLSLSLSRYNIYLPLTTGYLWRGRDSANHRRVSTPWAKYSVSSLPFGTSQMSLLWDFLKDEWNKCLLLARASWNLHSLSARLLIFARHLFHPRLFCLFFCMQISSLCADWFFVCLYISECACRYRGWLFQSYNPFRFVTSFLLEDYPRCRTVRRYSETKVLGSLL